MNKFNAKVLALALAVVLFFQGCAHESQQWITDLIAPSFDAATTAVLANAVSGDDALEKINMIYASAHALRSLSGGTINSEAVSRILEIWLPSKAHWSKYADSVTKTYERYFALLNRDAKQAVIYVEQMALGIESAANRSKKNLEAKQ